MKHIIISILTMFSIKQGLTQNLIPYFENGVVRKIVYNPNLKNDFLKNNNYFKYHQIRGFKDLINNYQDEIIDSSKGIYPFGKIDNTISKRCLMLLFFNNQNENLEIQLNDSLKKDEEYELSCYIQLTQASYKWLDHIPFYFTNKSIAYSSFGGGIYFTKNDLDKCNIDYLKMTPQNSDDLSKFKWTKISFKYKAKGGEKFLIIGTPFFKCEISAKKNKNKTTDYLNNSLYKKNIITNYNEYFKNYISYFVDSISLKLISENISHKEFEMHQCSFYEIRGISPNVRIERNKLGFEFEVNKLYEINKVYFQGSILDTIKSINGLESFKFNVLYSLNCASIDFIYKVKEIKEIKSGNDRLKYFVNYVFKNNELSNRYRLKVEVDSEINQPKLYYKIINF